MLAQQVDVYYFIFWILVILLERCVNLYIGFKCFEQTINNVFPLIKKIPPKAKLSIPWIQIESLLFTGTGKSSTISRVTGADVRTGAGAEPVTDQCQLYSDQGGQVWVDTVGWEDRFTDNTNIFQVPAIMGMEFQTLNWPAELGQS